MYKIEKIRVNNFKNIIDTDLELESMNVIVGPNNSGKSNFLQVIPFLKHIIRDDLDLIKDEFKTLDNVIPYLPYSKIYGKKSHDIFILNFYLEFINTESNIKSIYELELYVEDSSEPDPLSLFDYKISIHREGLWYKSVTSTGSPRRVFERGMNDLEFGEDLSHLKKVSGYLSAHTSVLRLLNSISFLKDRERDFLDSINGLNEILNSQIFYFSSFELRKNKDDNPQSFQENRMIWLDLNKEIQMLLKDESKKTYLEDALKKIIGIENIRFYRNAPDDLSITQPGTVLFKHYNLTHKTINDLSDGSLLLMAFIVEVLSSKNDIIFMEEPENSIHPKALEELIKFMKEHENEKQFIITSHSSTLLNIIKDPGNVVIVDVNEEGYSTLRKPKDIKAIRKKLSKGFLSLGDLLYFNIDGDIEDKEDAITY